MLPGLPSTASEGVLNQFDGHLTNAIPEGMNRLAQAAKSRARGYRTKHHRMTIANRFGGRLESDLPTCNTRGAGKRRGPIDVSRSMTPAHGPTSGVSLEDGRKLALTALNDRFTEHPWGRVAMGPNDLPGLPRTDRGMVELAERCSWDAQWNCEREPLGK